MTNTTATTAIPVKVSTASGTTATALMPERASFGDQMRSALILKQARRLVPMGKRRGKGFACGLCIYAGMARCARLDMRDVDRQPQGDRAEGLKAGIVGIMREQWESIAPARSLVRGGFLRGAK